MNAYETRSPLLVTAERANAAERYKESAKIVACCFGLIGVFLVAQFITQVIL